MAGELVASLRPWAIEDIQIGDQIYRIPPLNAADWLEHLSGPTINTWDIIPGLLEPRAEEHVTDLLIDTAVTRSEIEELVWEIVAITAGREWWTAIRLINYTELSETGALVRGQLVLNGVDATKISLAAWLDAVYAVIAPPHLSQENREKIDAVLRMPPTGVVPKIDRNRQRANFAALNSRG